MKSLLFLFGICLFSLASPCAAKPPNILFIMVDDLRPELGSYGVEHAETPHIDRLVRSSMRFDRAYCQIPVCGASRASLMTGLLPREGRFERFNSRADEEAAEAALLPEVLREAGYTTLSNGKVFHVRDDSESRSWSEPAWWPKDDYDDLYRRSFDPETTRELNQRKKRGLLWEAGDVQDGDYPDGEIAAKTIKDLQRLKETGKPFFLACGFVRPHLPFYAPKQYWDLYEAEAIDLASNRYLPENAPPALMGSTEFKSYFLGDADPDSDAFHRKMRHGYLASVSYVDALIGQVLAELERLELAENTVVILWGDHGFHLGEHTFWGKHNAMQHSLRVPLLMRAPGRPPAKTSALVETSDIFPTLMDLTGLDVPETVQGRSFVSLLSFPREDFREGVYARFKRKGYVGHTIITDRYSFTQYDKEGAMWEMLFDLDKDPDENMNIAGDPKVAGELSRLRKLLDLRKQEALENIE